MALAVAVLGPLDRSEMRVVRGVGDSKASGVVIDAKGTVGGGVRCTGEDELDALGQVRFVGGMSDVGSAAVSVAALEVADSARLPVAKSSGIVCFR